MSVGYIKRHGGLPIWDESQNKYVFVNNLLHDNLYFGVDGIPEFTHYELDDHLNLVNEHIDWTNATEDLHTDGSIEGEDKIEAGHPGTETAGIDIDGTVYAAKLRVNDIGGSAPAQVVVHRHSTTLESVIIGARSNTDDDTHAAITNGQRVLTIAGVGWTGSHYDQFADIRFGASNSGTISSTSSPGRIQFRTTPDGADAPALALTIDEDKLVTFAGSTSGVDHTELDNIGSHTHAQISTHINDADIHGDTPLVAGDASHIPFVKAAEDGFEFDQNELLYDSTEKRLQLGGTTSGTYSFSAVTYAISNFINETATHGVSVFRQLSDDTVGYNVTLVKSRGTEAVPASTQVGDSLGAFRWMQEALYTETAGAVRSEMNGGSIGMVVRAAPTGLNRSTDMSFNIVQGGADFEGMVLTSDDSSLGILGTLTFHASLEVILPSLKYAGRCFFGETGGSNFVDSDNATGTAGFATRGKAINNTSETAKWNVQSHITAGSALEVVDNLGEFLFVDISGQPNIEVGINSTVAGALNGIVDNRTIWINKPYWEAQFRKITPSTHANGEQWTCTLTGPEVPITTQTASTLTVTNAHETILADTSSNDITFTMPSAVTRANRHFTFKKIDGSNTVTINTVLSEDIISDVVDTTMSFTSLGDSFTLMSDGTQWVVI